MRRLCLATPILNRKALSRPPFGKAKFALRFRMSLVFSAFARRYWRNACLFIFHLVLKCFTSQGAHLLRFLELNLTYLLQKSWIFLGMYKEFKLRRERLQLYGEFFLPQIDSPSFIVRRCCNNLIHVTISVDQRILQQRVNDKSLESVLEKHERELLAQFPCEH